MSSALLFTLIYVSISIYLLDKRLCGEGGHQWAEKNGVPVCNHVDLITGNN